jgi:hypothetical protein
MGLDEVRVDIGTDALDSLLGDLGDPDPDPGRHTGVWRPPPDVDLPPVGDLAPSSAGLPVAGPRMLADLAARQTFALIDPDTGKLLKAWLFLVATGNCGGGGSNVKRLDDLLLGMKRGQASPRDLPIEYSVEQVSCGRGLRADELSRHRVILTDYVGVESTADLASHLASGGFAMTDSQQMEEMERVLRQEGKRNVERVELTSDHPLFHVFFDIDAATFEGMLGVPRPFLGLEIDGRLVAIGGLRCRIERTSGSTAGGAISGVALRPHLANMLYVNALAYGLVQPSALGGRYLQRASPQP